MASPPPKMKKTSAVTPRKTMRGHTCSVLGVAHLPDGKRTITCSYDDSLRLWDIESGAQIGEKWRDEGDKLGIRVMALSPNGKNIASGSTDGTVRLWNVETGKVVLKWKGHSDWVMSVCWSPDGKRVVSGSTDGTTRVWDAKSGEPVQGLNPMKGGKYVTAVSYSPGAKMIATGVFEKEIEIWDAKTGKRLTTIELDEKVFNLAWTSDENKLIVGLDGSIRILDTATWQQIADLDGHRTGAGVYSLTLYQNDRLLASTSRDGTARLWDLDTNRQVGPPLQHQDTVMCAAFSADGKLLSTGCHRPCNAYVWDIYAILKAAGLEELLSIPDVSANLTVIRYLIHNECIRHKTLNSKRRYVSFRGFLRMKHADAPTRTSRYQMYVAPFSDLETDTDIDILGQCYPTSTHPSNPRAASSATRLFRWCAKL
jgi:WD40 repeat protein